MSQTHHGWESTLRPPSAPGLRTLAKYSQHRTTAANTTLTSTTLSKWTVSDARCAVPPTPRPAGPPPIRPQTRAHGPATLDVIIEHKRQEVAAAKARIPLTELEAQVAQEDPVRNFFRAVTRSRNVHTTAVIAEV